MQKYHIVSIGVSKHQESFISNLEYAHKDAIDFSKLVELNVEKIGYNVLLTDSEATLAKIRTALGTDLLKEVGEDDYFFFFYSGHGTIDDESSGDGYAHYIVPFDATKDIKNSCIPVTYLKEVFNNLKCKSSIIFLDSCFSGGINSKHLSNLRKKSFKNLKTFTNTLSGKGSVVFTASKADEEAIEDEENRNGLFTYYLLEELQKDRGGDKFSVVDTFTPIAESVNKRALERYSCIQTPTFSGSLEGVIYLPAFKNRLPYTPDIIDLAGTPLPNQQPLLVPELEITDKGKKKIYNDLISLVTNTNQNNNPIRERIMFESACSKLIKQLEEKWNGLFESVGGDANRIKEAVVMLEGESFQFQMLGSVVAVFGSTQQMSTYGKYVSKILGWEKGRAGLVALIAAPEILVAEIISLIGMVSLANNNLSPFSTLVHTQVTLDYSRPPQPLYSYEHVFYCDALGGNSTNVHDHMRELFKTYDWLKTLSPELEDKTDDFELQTNFLLVILSVRNEGRLWADFARYYGSRIMPLIHKIKYDSIFQTQVSELYRVKRTEVREILTEAFRSVEKDWTGGGRFWWESISLKDFYTPEELEKETDS